MEEGKTMKIKNFRVKSSNFVLRSESVTENWDRQYRNYYREANPFDKKNKSRMTEWKAIYSAFDINPTIYPKLIDFGCGDGHFPLNFLKKGFKVTGIDISSEALSIFKRRTLKYKLSKNVHTIQSGLYKPLKNLEGKFDAGSMIVTYQFISNKKEEQKIVFKNFIKLIKKNGKVLIMEANPLNPLFYFYYLFISRTNSQQGFNTKNSKKEILIKLLEETGMSNIKIYYHSFLPTSFINNWSFIKNINKFLCSIPGIRNFSAFYIITAIKK